MERRGTNLRSTRNRNTLTNLNSSQIIWEIEPLNLNEGRNNNISNNINSSNNVPNLNNINPDSNIIKLDTSKNKKYKKPSERKNKEEEIILIKNLDSKKLNLQKYEEENKYEDPILCMRCIICFGFFNNPMMCDECNEIYCEKCIYNDLNKNDADPWESDSFNQFKCPHCRAKFKPIKIQKQLMDIINRTKIKCPNEKGCNDIFTYENLMNHLKNCETTVFFYQCKYCQMRFDHIKNRNLKALNKIHFNSCKKKPSKNTQNNIKNDRKNTISINNFSPIRLTNNSHPNLNMLFINNPNLLNRNRRRNENDSFDNILDLDTLNERISFSSESDSEYFSSEDISSSHSSLPNHTSDLYSEETEIVFPRPRGRSNVLSDLRVRRLDNIMDRLREIGRRIRRYNITNVSNINHQRSNNGRTHNRNNN